MLPPSIIIVIYSVSKIVCIIWDISLCIDIDENFYCRKKLKPIGSNIVEIFGLVKKVLEEMGLKVCLKYNPLKFI